MNLTEKQFFALLQGGLWGKLSDPSLFQTPADWKKIYDLANRQTVLGIVGDGIAEQVEHPDIPDPYKAPAEYRKKFLVQVVKAERRNAKLNDFIVRYNRIFTRAGITPVIVKGQAVALSYPHPMHRQSGDIDYFLTPDDYQKAKAIVAPVATEVEKEDSLRLHYNCTVEGITVEFHGEFTESGSPMRNEAMRRFRERHLREPLRYWDLDGERIPLMNHHFDVIYILQHFHHHMVTSGVGLRQICDWIMYVSAWGDTLDPDLLAKDLQEMSLLRVWKVYAAFTVRYLGIEPGRMPLYDPSYERYSSRIWRIIRKTGNFGKFEKGKPMVGMPLIPRKLRSFAFIVKQTSRLFPIFPSEAFRRLIHGTKTGLGRIGID